MANHKKEESDKKKPRCVTLSQNQIREIKTITGKDSLSEAIRELYKMAEKLEIKNE